MTSYNTLLVLARLLLRSDLLNCFDIVKIEDGLFSSITLFEAQILTSKETVARLKVDEYFNQISFHSQIAADRLKLVESLEILE